MGRGKKRRHPAAPRLRSCCASGRLLLRALLLVIVAACDAAMDEPSSLQGGTGGLHRRRGQQEEEGVVANATAASGEAGEDLDLPPLLRVWVSYQPTVTHSASLGALQSYLAEALELPQSAINFDGLMEPDHDLVPFTRRRRRASAIRELQPEEGVANSFRIHYDFFDSGLGSIAMSVAPEVVEALRKDPAVRIVQRDPPRYALEALDSEPPPPPPPPPHLRRRRELDEAPYGIGMVNSPAAWRKGYRGRGIKVCVMDTGLDMRHPEFSKTGWTGVSTAAGTWSTDGYGHGTHVTGTLAARKNRVGVVGVAPLARVVVVKVFDSNGKWAYASSVADAALECHKRGAKVINMSLGGTGSSQGEDDAFAWLHKNGVVSVAAAANAGTTEYWYPASYGSVVSVAAIDSRRRVADFSQKNDRVDLAAPGVGVYSTLPVNYGSYGYLSGTSMATPHVAGVAAILFSKNSTLPAAAIVRAMTASAIDLGKSGYDTSYGHGLVSAGAALARV